MTTFLDVLPVILGHWTNSCPSVAPRIQDIAMLSSACKTISMEIKDCPCKRLYHQGMCSQVPLLKNTNILMNDDCCIDILRNSCINVPRYLHAMSTLECCARANASAIIAKICSQSVPIQNIGIDLKSAFSPSTILKNPVTSYTYRHVVNTMICLSTLMSVSCDMYDVLLSGEWTRINMLPLHHYCTKDDGDNNKNMINDLLYNRHVDFRLHTTYLFFYFIGNVVSSNITLGYDLTRTLQGQLLEAWRTKWNENNKRMYAKTMYLLDRVYDKLAREYGPPPSIVIAHMMAHNT